MTTILRMDQLKASLQLSRTQIYRLIQTGLLPSQIKIGARASAWVADEIALVIKARSHGLSDEQVRQFVSELLAARPFADVEARRTLALRRHLRSA